jgi:predicted aspartyl protease
MPPDRSDSHPGYGVLDTGSTLSTIPRRTLRLLRLEPVTVLRVRDAEGRLRPTDAYDVLFTVPQHFSAPLRVLSTNSDEPLIGRDVMDTLRITFDGPRKELEVEPVR